MKNNKIMAIALAAGLTLGGLVAASAASAQSESDTTTSTVVVADDSTDAGSAEVETEGRQGRRGGCNLDAAAAAIGIDEATLREAIDNGGTIAEVAETNGVSPDTVIDAMVADQEARLAEKVADGALTQEAADEKLAEARAEIADRVNGVEAAGAS